MKNFAHINDNDVLHISEEDYSDTGLTNEKVHGNGTQAEIRHVLLKRSAQRDQQTAEVSRRQLYYGEVKESCNYEPKQHCHKVGPKRFHLAPRFAAHPKICP